MRIKTVCNRVTYITHHKSIIAITIISTISILNKPNTGTDFIAHKLSRLSPIQENGSRLPVAEKILSFLSKTIATVNRNNYLYSIRLVSIRNRDDFHYS